MRFKVTYEYTVTRHYQQEVIIIADSLEDAIEAAKANPLEQTCWEEVGQMESPVLQQVELV